MKDKKNRTEKTKNSFTLKFAGHVVQVVTDHDEESFSFIQSYVDQIYSSARKETGSAQKALILTNLRLAEDLLNIKREYKKDLSEIKARLQKVSQEL